MADDRDTLTKSDSSKKCCNCKEADGLFVPTRQLSLLVAGTVLALFIMFTGAFFWGQKYAIASFTNKIEKESFGDQIYSSLCALCDSQGDIEEDDTGDTSEEGSSTEEVEKDGSESGSNASDQQAEEVAQDQDTSESGAGQDEHVELSNSANPEYYAQLAGFGTIRAAQHFASRLQKKEVSVIVKKRQSRSTRGRFVSWYQVVTEKFHDKGDLEALVKRLEYEEKLNDVRIIAC